jgi:beta-phosphoglucomutase
MGDWPAAVLFDFDGVIVNSEPVHLRAFQLAAATEGINLTPQQYYRELIGYDDAGAWRRIFHLHDKPLNEKTLERAMQQKFALMRQLLQTNQIPALPGVHECVRTLDKQGLALAICSAAVREEIMAMLMGLGLAPLFPVITSAEDVAVGKPDPSCYLLTLARLS